MSDSSRDAAGGPVDAGESEERSLRTQFATTELSRHLALFYRSRAEQMATVAAFVNSGIRGDEKVVYLADDNDRETVVDCLEAAGVDVECHVADDRLQILERDEVYINDPFDPIESVDAFEAMVEEAVADGYAGLRVAGENTWSFGLDCEFDRVIEFEVHVDDRCPDMPVTAMCQYSLEQFDDAAIGKALQTHEQVIYRGRLCENPYYVPPKEALERGVPRSNAALLLEQTRDVDQFHHDIESREQRLSVVNRVLRHNLRNEINVIKGRISLLERQVDPDGQMSDQFDTVHSAADRLLELAEKARHVDQTLEAGERTRTPLAEAVTVAVDDVRIQRPDADVTVQGLPPGVVLADEAVRLAVFELVWLALDDTPDGEVRVSGRHATARDEVVITVEADAPFVSAAAREAISRNTEEALSHTKGLGLWVAIWIAEEVNGSVTVPGDGASDSIELSVPTVPIDETGR